MTKLSVFCLMVLVLISFVLQGCSDDGSDHGVFNPKEVGLHEVPGQDLMELTTDNLTFSDPNEIDWIAPQGTWTDGASIPRLALWLTDGRFQSEFLKAAIVHDAYCQSINADRCPDQYQTRPWQDVHRMFYNACLAGDTSSLLAKIMFAAVWVGGPRWDDPASDLQGVPDEVLRIGFADCRKWIEDDEPTLEQIEAWFGQREPTVRAICELEARAITALRSGDESTARAALRRSENRLQSELRNSPDDLMLLGLQGFNHTRRAEVFGELQMNIRRDEALNKAEGAFQKIITRELEDPTTLRGMGKIMELRQDLGDAELFMQRALDASPADPAARRDLERVETLRAAQENQ